MQSSFGAAENTVAIIASSPFWASHLSWAARVALNRAVAAFLFWSPMKAILILLAPVLIAGCAEQSMEDVIPGASQAASAYARGYSETYQQQSPAPPAPYWNDDSGIKVYYPPVGEGLPVIYRTDNLGNIYQY
jgi:hypothetical protein